MSWKLRTTGAEDFLSAIAEIRSGERSFLWFTAHESKERGRLIAICRATHLDILDMVPVWFVLACHPGVGSEDRERMVRSILVGAGFAEDSRWRGRMFGYPEEDIDWYVKEVEAAWERFNLWKEGENG